MDLAMAQLCINKTPDYKAFYNALGGDYGILLLFLVREKQKVQ
ncbi:MAG: hypothetical protein ACJAUP_002021 [Cellvibrionaceae bacterium]|jgi:hypothetical protein